jgi:hypothetical protein
MPLAWLKCLKGKLLQVDAALVELLHPASDPAPGVGMQAMATFYNHPAPPCSPLQMLLGIPPNVILVSMVKQLSRKMLRRLIRSVM